MSLIWIKLGKSLQRRQFAQQILAHNHNPVTVETDRAAVFERSQGAADGFRRGGEVGRNGSARDAGSAQSGVVCLLEQEARQAHDDAVEGEVFHTVNKSAHAPSEQPDHTQRQHRIGSEGSVEALD